MRLFYFAASVQNVLAGSKSDHYLKKFGLEKKLGDRSIPNFDHFNLGDYDPVPLPALEPQPCMPDDLQNTWVDSYDDDCDSYFDDGFCTSDGQFGPYYEYFAAEMVHYGIASDASFLIEEGFDEFAQGGYTAANCKACGCVEPTTTTAAPTTTTTAQVSPLVGQLIRIEARNKNTLEPLGVFLINNLNTVDFQKFKPQQKPAEFKLHSLFKVHQGDDSFGDNAIKLESVSRPGQFLTSSPGLPFHIGLSQEFKTGSEQHFLLEVTKDDDSELQAKVKEIESGTYLLWMSQKVDGKIDFVASFKNWDAIAAFGNISRNSVFIIKKDQGVPEIVEQNLGPLEVMHVSFNNLVLQTFGNTSKYSRSLRNPMKKNINRMKRFYKTNQCPNVQHFTMRSNAPDVTPCGQLHALVTDIQGWVTENMNDCANKPNQPADQRMERMVGRLDRFKKTINSQCEKKYSKTN